MNIQLRRPMALTKISLLVTLLVSMWARTAWSQAPAAPTNPATVSPTAHRLTYTLTEKDGGKVLGIQHFNLTTLADRTSEIKVGSRVPYLTGGKNDAIRQYSYSDVGLTIHVFSREFSNGLQVESTVEQSSFAPSTDDQISAPVIRQTKFESNALLSTGRPMQLGSFDVPGSTRHYEVDVVLESVR